MPTLPLGHRGGSFPSFPTHLSRPKYTLRTPCSRHYTTLIQSKLSILILTRMYYIAWMLQDNDHRKWGLNLHLTWHCFVKFVQKIIFDEIKKWRQSQCSGNHSVSYCSCVGSCWVGRFTLEATNVNAFNTLKKVCQMKVSFSFWS